MLLEGMDKFVNVRNILTPTLKQNQWNMNSKANELNENAVFLANMPEC